MGSASNAKVQIESGQSLVEYEQLTDVGDHTIFNPSAALMSSVYTPTVRVDGVVTGNNLISISTNDDEVSVAAHTGNAQGVQLSVAAGTVSVTRPLSDVAKVVSITVTSAGALAAVEGTDGSDTTFSAIRGAAGGPPYIPVGSYEIGQVRMTTSAAAVITSSEIKQNGEYTERATSPVYSTNPIGNGISAEDTGTTYAYVEFNEALPTIHTGDETKGVFCEYYTPSFADVPKSSDFSPAETSHSISSEDTYDGSVGSSSSSLGSGSFSVLLDDGVNDLIVSNKNKNLTVKFFPNRNSSAYILTQGLVGISRSFPASGGQINADVTIVPEVASAEFSS
jgi:hypothetical protein